MKYTLVTNTHFHVAVDQEKNRLYIKIKGMWAIPAQFVSYLETLKVATDMLRRKFTCLADFSEMLPYSQEVRRQIHVPALEILRDCGVSRGAQVIPASYQTSCLLEEDGKTSNIRFAFFSDEEIAESYLDATPVHV